MPEKSQVSKLREDVDALKKRIADLEDRLESLQEVISPEEPVSAVRQLEIFREPGPGGDGARSGMTDDGAPVEVALEGLRRRVPSNKQFAEIRQTTRKLGITYSQFALVLVQACRKSGHDPVQILRSAMDLYDRLGAISSKDETGGNRLN